MTTYQTSPDVIFLSVVITINERQGVSIIISDSLPVTYLVRFKVTGKIVKKSGKFLTHLLYPLDGYPELNPREEGHLAQALNDAAASQVSMPVSIIKKGMINTDDVGQLARRQLQLRIEP